MNLIPYTQRLDAQVNDLWNKTLTFDPILLEAFYDKTIFDENFDPSLCFLAVEEDKLLGFILAMKRRFPYLERGLEPEKGWITAMAVEPEFQRQGIGSKLLQAAEQALQDRGATEIILGSYSPNYFFAGVDKGHYPNAAPFFEKHGYVSGASHYSMGRDLHGYAMRPETLKKKAYAESLGYKFIPYSNEYALDLLEHLKNEFGGGWKRNALIAMQKKKAAERMLLVISPEGNIVGSVNRAIDDNDMRFGPVGVSKSIRNLGLGTILLEMQMLEMAKRGIYRMYFVTTNEAGRRYYERAGLDVIRTFVEYKKTLENPS
jgi:GNAT superfamily N-acetyltransferase